MYGVFSAVCVGVVVGIGRVISVAEFLDDTR